MKTLCEREANLERGRSVLRRNNRAVVVPRMRGWPTCTEPWLWLFPTRGASQPREFATVEAFEEVHRISSAPNVRLILLGRRDLSSPSCPPKLAVAWRPPAYKACRFRR